MSDQKRYFKFTVSGQYVALHDAGAKTLRSYCADFVLPSPEGALSIICKHLLDDTLRKKYSDYIKFRTHAITKTAVVGREPNPSVVNLTIEEMNFEQLSDFCILRNILIDPYKHGAITNAREVISAAYRMQRLAIKEKEEHKDAKVNKEVDELRKLNNLEPQNDGLSLNINQQLAEKASLPINPKRISNNEPVPGDINDEPLPDFVDDNTDGSKAPATIQ